MKYRIVNSCSVAAILLLLLWLSACSRPQKVVQPQARVSADATLRLAQNLETRHRWTDSIQSYESTVMQYQRIGEIRGQIYAYAGLARIAFINDDLALFADYRDKLQYLIKNADPSGKYIGDLLDIYVLESRRQYQEALNLAQDSYEYPIQIRIQMLSHRLQAESYLNPGYPSPTYDDLKRLASRYRGILKKDLSADPSVLASAEYAMSYHTFLAKNYPAAMTHVDQAIDLDYRYENFGALGASYWLRGSIHNAMGEAQSAIANYVKAKDILLHFPNPLILDQLNTALEKLQEIEP